MSTMSGACFRFLAISIHRYSRDPGTRAVSSRHALVAAIGLHAEETSSGEAALAAAEALSQIVVGERLKRLAEAAVAEAGARG